MKVEELSRRAKKAMALQSRLEETFGSHPFYKELSYMAALQDAHYTGSKKGAAEVLKSIPSNQQIDKKANEYLFKTVEEDKAFRQGIHFIINSLTDNT